MHGTRGSWIKHGIDPQEEVTVAGLAPGGEKRGLIPTTDSLTLAEPTRADLPMANRRGDYRLFWSTLAAAIRDGQPNPVPASEAMMVMEVLHAGLRSAAERREVLLS